jgi:hypothetical protein
MNTGFYDFSAFGLALSEKRRMGHDDVLIFIKDEITNLKSILACVIDDFVIECYKSEIINEARDLIDLMIRVDPANPLNWLSLANHYALKEGNFELSNKYMRKSISTARKYNNFYIHCNIESLRICMQFSNVRLAGRLLKNIIEYDASTSRLDSDYQVKYIASLAKFGVSQKIINEYIEKFSGK